eukprot:52082-Chlamydomonas_euryale.AAC.10
METHAKLHVPVDGACMYMRQPDIQAGRLASWLERTKDDQCTLHASCRQSNTPVADQVGAVRHRRAAGSAQIQQLCARLDVDVVNAGQHRRCQLGAERVPHAVLDLLALVGTLDGDALLAVHGDAGHQVARHERVLLAARDEDAI